VELNRLNIKRERVHEKLNYVSAIRFATAVPFSEFYERKKNNKDK
jgi:hypothetical protein